MTKQHFIALADMIRGFNQRGLFPEHPFTKEHIDALADFCDAQNPRFDRERWLNYIAGTHGKNGGKLK
jgi:hypothetical protein